VTLESTRPGPELPAPGLELPAPGPELPAPAPASEPGRLDWDALVAGNQRATYLQTTAWGVVKRPNGWEPVIRESRSGPAAIGAQFLLRQPRAMPWVFAYAPRGPIADPWTREGLVRWAGELRERPWPGDRRVSHLRIEPEIEADGSDLHRDVLVWLRRAGFRAAPAIQPTTTRIVDLRDTEEALWSDLRKKWRQYVNKARAAGVAVMDGDGDRLPGGVRAHHGDVKAVTHDLGEAVIAGAAADHKRRIAVDGHRSRVHVIVPGLRSECRTGTVAKDVICRLDRDADLRARVVEDHLAADDCRCLDHAEQIIAVSHGRQAYNRACGLPWHAGRADRFCGSASRQILRSPPAPGSHWRDGSVWKRTVKP